jgi:hypothetical protein
LGIGDWAQSPIPNPQSPIPNPQSPNIISGNENYNSIRKIFNIDLKYKFQIIIYY